MRIVLGNRTFFCVFQFSLFDLAAVTSLAKFGAGCEDLLPSVVTLLER